MRRIVVIDGHPDVSGERYLHALAEAYAVGAASAGHEVRVIRVAALDFPIIRTREEWEHQKPPADIVEAQDAVKWAQHVVLLYPLWLGDVPALLKGFLEQLSRPGFAFEYDNRGGTRTLLDAAQHASSSPWECLRRSTAGSIAPTASRASRGTC